MIAIGRSPGKTTSSHYIIESFCEKGACQSKIFLTGHAPFSGLNSIIVKRDAFLKTITRYGMINKKPENKGATKHDQISNIRRTQRYTAQTVYVGRPAIFFQ